MDTDFLHKTFEVYTYTMTSKTQFCLGVPQSGILFAEMPYASAFYLAQTFSGGNMGEVEVMGRLVAQGGGCGRGMCPLPCKAREAKA